MTKIAEVVEIKFYASDCIEIGVCPDAYAEMSSKALLDIRQHGFHLSVELIGPSVDQERLMNAIDHVFHSRAVQYEKEWRSKVLSSYQQPTQVLTYKANVDELQKLSLFLSGSAIDMYRSDEEIEGLECSDGRKGVDIIYSYSPRTRRTRTTPTA